MQREMLANFCEKITTDTITLVLWQYTFVSLAINHNGMQTSITQT